MINSGSGRIEACTQSGRTGAKDDKIVMGGLHEFVLPIIVLKRWASFQASEAGKTF
jgi:hypothetical protein